MWWTRPLPLTAIPGQGWCDMFVPWIVAGNLLLDGQAKRMEFAKWLDAAFPPRVGRPWETCLSCAFPRSSYSVSQPHVGSQSWRTSWFVDSEFGTMGHCVPNQVCVLLPELLGQCLCAKSSLGWILLRCWASVDAGMGKTLPLSWPLGLWCCDRGTWRGAVTTVCQECATLWSTLSCANWFSVRVSGQTQT